MYYDTPGPVSPCHAGRVAEFTLARYSQTFFNGLGYGVISSAGFGPVTFLPQTSPLRAVLPRRRRFRRLLPISGLWWPRSPRLRVGLHPEPEPEPRPGLLRPPRAAPLNPSLFTSLRGWPRCSGFWALQARLPEVHSTTRPHHPHF